MNIAMLGHKRIPSREGGVEIVVEELSTRMVQKGHTVTCYNRKGHNVAGAKFDGKKYDCYRGVKCINVFTIDIKGLAAMTSSFFASIRVSFGKYDIVHFHAEGPSFMCWLPKLFGKRVVVTIHGLDHQRAKWGKLASTYIMLGEKNAVHFADEIIVLSQSVKNYFTSTYGRATKYVPNGVNKPEIRVAEQIIEKFGLTEDSYFLFLGRIVPEKGVRYLIEAFKKVKTNKKLVIAGGSSDTDAFVNELKELAKGDKRIIFTGFVQGRILEELYSNAYVYCLPTDIEGMPLSLLEAMSYGNCCLTSDIPECVDVVEDKAVAFERGNVKDLKEKLEWLTANPNEVKRYKSCSASYICEKFSWDDMVKKTIDLYENR